MIFSFERRWSWSSVGLVVLLAAAALPSVSCDRLPKTIELDPRFSYNVVHVPAWFPPKNHQMTPAEQEVMQRRGRPEFIRFWWNPEGRFISSEDLSGKSLDIDEVIRASKQTWIYLGERKNEIEFKSSGGYFEHPVTDQLELICKYGDPSTKTPPKPDSQGRMKETWAWVDHGLRIDFIDGLELKRNYFTGTGRGTDLLK